jgi:hypothetical protein
MYNHLSDTTLRVNHQTVCECIAMLESLDRFTPSHVSQPNSEDRAVSSALCDLKQLKTCLSGAIEFRDLANQIASARQGDRD